MRNFFSISSSNSFFDVGMTTIQPNFNKLILIVSNKNCVTSLYDIRNGELLHEISLARKIESINQPLPLVRRCFVFERRSEIFLSLITECSEIFIQRINEKKN